MIRATTFAGQRVAVFGLGGSGSATVASLCAGGAEVAAWDDNERARDGAAASGIRLVDLGAADWSGFDALVLAPGVPLTHPEPHWTVRAAQACGVKVIGDIEVFCRERQARAPESPLVAITGTNGKSTTTALVAHLLRCTGADVQMGGNIGIPVLSLSPPADERIHVVEMSSFQIDLTPTLTSTVGVLLNLSPDHLDRHGPADDAGLAMRNYASIKERLVRSARAAAVGVDDAFCRAILEQLEDAGIATYPFTTGKGAAVIPRLYAIGATLFVHEQHQGYAASTEITTLSGIPTLRGRHNVQNALAALAALRALQDQLDRRAPGSASVAGVWQLPVLAEGLKTYPGLPHRMEQVGRQGRTIFINDSKATNADSTEKALATWDRDIFWILGGKPKEGGIRSLAPYFPRVAKAYLIGQATDDFAAALAGQVACERCGTLDVAVAAAARDAARCGGDEPVVLLSPACASYDQFRSFEHRGDTFRALVQAMADAAVAPRDAP